MSEESVSQEKSEPGFFGNTLSKAGLFRYGSSTAWLAADRILRLSIGVLVATIMTRYLGPTQFGLLGYAKSYALSFSPLAAFGLDQGVVMNLLRFPERKQDILANAVSLRLLGSVAAFSLAG